MNGKKSLEEIFQSMNKDYIRKRQDEPGSLRLLAAMRYLYGQSKYLRLIRVGLTIIIPVVSVICAKFFPSIIHTIAILSALWLIINRVWLQEVEKNIVQKAATIQEEFDVGLFQLNWNNTLVGEKLEPEFIMGLNQKFNGDRDKLKEWYQGLNSSSHFTNVLLAQRTNIVWDMNLRKFYGNLLFTIFFLCLFGSLLIGFYSNLSVQTLILSLFVPSLPLLLHLVETANAHKKRAYSLKSISTSISKEITYPTSCDIRNKCRQFQDSVYLKRCDINTVPDKVYWIKRVTYDRLAKEVNEEYSNNEN